MEEREIGKASSYWLLDTAPALLTNAMHKKKQGFSTMRMRGGEDQDFTPKSPTIIKIKSLCLIKVIISKSTND